jgi:hypothetical protein
MRKSKSQLRRKTKKRTWQHIFQVVMGCLLIALGLLISGTAAANAISDARVTASGFDQGDPPAQTSMGFEPIIVTKTNAIEIPTQ